METDELTRDKQDADPDSNNPVEEWPDYQVWEWLYGPEPRG